MRPFGAQHLDLVAVVLDLVEEARELLLLPLDAILQLEQAEAGDRHQGQPEQGADAHHAAASRMGPQAGAALRSAPRRRAERARGLAAISASPATASSPGQRWKLGAICPTRGREMARCLRRASRARAQESLDAAVLERMEGDDGEPAAGLQQRLGGGEAAVELAELVVHGDAQRLEGAGRRIDGVALLARPRTLADDRGELARCG